MLPQYRSAEGVCVTGMGICLPVARGCEAVARTLIAGGDAIDHVKSFDGTALASDWVSEFAPEAKDFGLTEKERSHFDRGAWFAIAATEEALAQAAFATAGYAPERVGVIVGTSHSGIQHIEKSFLHLRAANNGKTPAAWLAAASTDHTASVVSKRVGALGPKSTISSACASSNTAVGLASDWLIRNEVDCVIVIGTDTVSPSILAGFNALRAMSTSPSAPFSTPPGITLGEGAGVVILERTESAQQRSKQPLAWIRGYGLSGDAYHETATDTEGRGVEAAMRFALADAGMVASDIDYVSAHGTGTDANDIPESLATARVVGNHTPLSSPKSFLGHTLGASGVVELIVTLLFAEQGLVPPTRHFNAPRAGCPPLNYVPNEAQKHNVNAFLCNNYGFGGNNSSLVVTRKAGPAAHRLLDDAVAIVGGGAVGDFGLTTQALFDRLWNTPGPLPRDDQWGVHAGRAEKVLKGVKAPCNPRSSTMIKSGALAAEQAIVAAGGRALIAADPYRCALICGITHGAQRSVEKFMTSIFDEGLQFGSAIHFPMTTMNAMGGQISIEFGIKGFNTTFCGAVTAFSYAHALVRDGRQDRALSVGGDELSPLVIRALQDIGLLATDAVMPFRATPGVNPGEGAGAVLLERLSIARARNARVAALISGIGLAQDGLLDSVDPSGTGLQRAANQALAAAKITAKEIDAVVLPGTGPRNLLLAEASALEALFGRAVPPRVSAASATGMAPSALFPMHILLAAEILARHSEPPQAQETKPSNIVNPRHILVLHTSAGGEFSAVIVSNAEGVH
ncbi:MAG: beta-ketoacyl-[acyl-carrier-protein] synthase family protein [Pseudomonadota bacterium]